MQYHIIFSSLFGALTKRIKLNEKLHPLNVFYWVTCLSPILVVRLEFQTKLILVKDGTLKCLKDVYSSILLSDIKKSLLYFLVWPVLSLKRIARNFAKYTDAEQRAGTLEGIVMMVEFNTLGTARKFYLRECTNWKLNILNNLLGDLLICFLEKMVH